MAEPTLSLTLDEVRREVARFLSFGREYDSLTDVQRADVDAVIRRGLRQFYAPPPSPAGAAHEWSFLRPTVSLATVAGQQSYRLPDDFGAMMGSRLTRTSRHHVQGPLLVSDYHYRSVVESSTLRAGDPAIATIRPRTAAGVEETMTVTPIESLLGSTWFDASAGVTVPTRHDLFLFPVPDAVATYQYQYHAIQDAVASALDHPAGAAMHGETILASCLAIAEEYVVSPTTQYRQMFRERLASSIGVDRAARGGGIIGRMRATGDDRVADAPRVSLVRYVG